jgi:hypothetical protein
MLFHMTSMNVREPPYMKNVWRLHGDMWANDARGLS